jgi:hypothetical protein
MCFFKKKTDNKKTYPFTHPEEPADNSVTMSNYNLDDVFSKWKLNYKVPAEYYDYWRNRIEIEITDTIGNPAATWDVPNGRHLAVRPEYLNPGVIAHEQAHNSYALLTDTDKTQFAAKLADLRKSSEMVKYLYKEKKYAIHDSDIEAHAEIYRYIDVPDEIKQYYPKLF